MIKLSSAYTKRALTVETAGDTTRVTIIGVPSDPIGGMTMLITNDAARALRDYLILALGAK